MNLISDPDSYRDGCSISALIEELECQILFIFAQ